MNTFVRSEQRRKFGLRMDQIYSVTIERRQYFLQRAQTASRLGGAPETVGQALSVGIGLDPGEGGRGKRPSGPEATRARLPLPDVCGP